MTDRAGVDFCSDIEPKSRSHHRRCKLHQVSRNGYGPLYIHERLLGRSSRDDSPVLIMPLTSKPLTPDTWPAFARLVEKHNGIFGGCWCISFHLQPGEKRHGAEAYRAMKKALVREGRAHAALVFDGPNAVGWCQFGPTAELPNIRSKKAYEEGLGNLPDWRITCFFIDRERRGEGVATFALREALREIRRLGGGIVEAYPEDYTGQKISSSFLCSGTLGMFEKAGFKKTRKIAMHRWVVVRRLLSKRASREAN